MDECAKVLRRRQRRLAHESGSLLIFVGFCYDATAAAAAAHAFNPPTGVAQIFSRFLRSMDELSSSSSNDDDVADVIAIDVIIGLSNADDDGNAQPPPHRDAHGSAGVHETEPSTLAGSRPENERS